MSTLTGGEARIHQLLAGQLRRRNRRSLPEAIDRDGWTVRVDGFDPEKERFHEALSSFDDAIVIHDISTCKSVVHTDYSRLEHTVLKKECTILTHSPDTITSEWALSKAEKSFLIQGGTFSEMAGAAQAEFPWKPGG